MTADRQERETLKARLTARFRPFLAGDLEWAILSPPLLPNSLQAHLARLPETRALIDRVRNDPSPLLDTLLTMKRQNLGTYFEHLIFFWLENMPGVQVRGKNLQVREDKQTLGEMDVLFDYDGACWHWELAVKFYLNAGDRMDPWQWVGPMKRDTLGRKLDRLFSHQLTLPETPAGQACLSRLGIKEVTSSPMVKGMLFSAARQDSAYEPGTTPLPPSLSPQCLQSCWMTLHQFQADSSLPFTHFRILKKPRWISPIRDFDDLVRGDQTVASAALAHCFQGHAAPHLILLARQDADHFTEIRRLFVTPNDWP
ncbi:DUF1853 family protein [Sneathiella chinensis]|uniref:DUF1853 family protein n=1 Tax=Sneathiella chinensis TaxID=349750 RepID=A0ABQ5U433_9PROT|nr:DUF1853 family protein [Sneathiella chinensis]GLQ06674.1 hypothetical protein GCM10007924_18950 [Sneathiella chinensis]